MTNGQAKVLSITCNPELWGATQFSRGDIAFCLNEGLITPNGAVNENTWGYDLTEVGQKALKTFFEQ